MPFKILLILNNAPGHSPFIGDIPKSKWCFSLHTPTLWSNQWIKELQQLF